MAGSHVFIDRSTRGPGTTPPEGADFAAGQPIAPISPFDWFSTAPQLPGAAGQLQYRIGLAYRTPGVTVDTALLLSSVAGDVTNAIYWGEPLLGRIDPHEGRSALPYAVAYPARGGTNDAFGAQVLTPYSVSVRSAGDRFRVTGGYVTPALYDGFVFTPPALTNVSPTLNLQTFESSGPPLADLATWTHLASSLPLAGVDARADLGGLALEATDGVLPGPSGTSARLIGGAIVYDRAEAGRYSANVVHVTTHGDAIGTPTLFGADPILHPGPQGDLASSTLGEQRQTIVGARAFFHPRRGYDALAEIGRSWYDARVAARPGSSRPGNYQHYGLTRTFDANDAVGIEYYRMDPRYATAVLPYGIQENLWGTAWAYPGPWLKGTYQLVNDNFGGSNRVGFRVHGDLTRGPLQAHAALYGYRQLSPSTYDNLTQLGFVEVDYLTLRPGDTALGRTRGVDASLGYTFARDTITLDYAHDLQRRDGAGSARGDDVAMRYPQLVIANQHRFSAHALAAVGFGRYAASGTWTTTPVAAIYSVGFAGVELDLGRGQQLFVQLRQSGLSGAPSIPGGPPPTFNATSLTIDHHVTL
ncbi:MAG: hypothetical protein NVSMB21_15950 [Vulcanimicrobiaceae bacterium]